MPESTEVEIDQISHKLINQIAIVCSYADLLKDSELTEDQKELLDEIVKAGSQAVELHRALSKRIAAIPHADSETESAGPPASP